MQAGHSSNNSKIASTGFQQNNNLTHCPFNSAHTFSKDRLIYHISKCKDKIKRMPFLAICKYNPMHYIDKQRIKQHEEVCQNREQNENRIKQHGINWKKYQRDYLQNTQRMESQNRQERERSRDRQENNRWNGQDNSRMKIQQAKEQDKIKKQEHIFGDHTLSECQQCQNLLQKFKQDIKKDRKLSKLLEKYEQLKEQ